MADTNRQAGRIARLSTPLGEDELVLTRFDGSEGISEIFEFRVEALSSTVNINFDKAIGKHCTVTFETIGDAGTRYFDGILTEAQWLGVRDDQNVYRLVLRPWLWLLSFRTDCFIFHEKTVVQIIKEVFARHENLAKYTDELEKKDHPKIEYCVQYRESDLNFVCRLMEEYGISYYFRHTDGEHVLVLADERNSYEKIAGGSRSYISIVDQHRRDEEHFYQWIPERRFTSGKVTLTDYNFKTPTANMQTSKTGDAQFSEGKLELYDYPGIYEQTGSGQHIADVKLYAARSPDGHFVASGDCVSCFPGSLVTLQKHPDAAQNREYLTLRCVHTYLSEEFRTGNSSNAGDQYQGNYEFVASDRRYAPAAVTEKPCVYGPQTAVVVGEGEIDVDKFGRILVHFFWDRKGDKSMRCRLAQVWSGKNWGGVFIPRVGMEVIVEFLEGNPDRPVIIGTVYNQDNMPPYDLPGEKNIAGLKSNSTIGGGGYNELIFDDTAGKELIRMHAQYDRETVIEHDERRTVHHDRQTKIDNDQQLTVGNNETNSIGVDRQTKIGKKDKLDVGDTLKVTVENEIVIQTGAASITMKKDGTITIKGINITISDGGNLTTKGIRVQHTASGDMTIKGAVVKIN